MDASTTSTPGADDEHPIAVVVHLSGKLRGTTERLSGQSLKVGTALDAEVHFPADHEPEVAESHATLSQVAPVEPATVPADSEVEVVRP